MGGYNCTISSDRGSPIAGRQALERKLRWLYHDCHGRAGIPEVD